MSREEIETEALLRIGLVMLMAGAHSIREVMAFPKTQTAACLLTNAPSEVGLDQLRELSLRIRKPATEEG